MPSREPFTSRHGLYAPLQVLALFVNLQWLAGADELYLVTAAAAGGEKNAAPAAVVVKNDLRVVCLIGILQSSRQMSLIIIASHCQKRYFSANCI